jgi:hypothetical protein
MDGKKNIVCDACGKTHLAAGYHLEPNLDLCLDCAKRAEDGTLLLPYMKKFIAAVRKLMTYEEPFDEVAHFQLADSVNPHKAR